MFIEIWGMLRWMEGVHWRDLCVCIYTIDIKKVDKQLTNAMHGNDIYVNGTFIDKLTKWYQ